MLIAIYVSAIVVRGGCTTVRGGYFVYGVNTPGNASVLVGFFPTAYNHSLDTLPAPYRHAHLISSFSVSPGEYRMYLADQKERDADAERADKGDQLAYPKSYAVRQA